MKKQDFEKLVESVKQAGKIRRGEMKASRTFKYAPADIKAIRMRLKKSQSEFALMIGASAAARAGSSAAAGRPRGGPRVWGCPR